jgi:hypothetical protein
MCKAPLHDHQHLQGRATTSKQHTASVSNLDTSLADVDRDNLTHFDSQTLTLVDVSAERPGEPDN